MADTTEEKIVVQIPPKLFDFPYVALNAVPEKVVELQNRVEELSFFSLKRLTYEVLFADIGETTNHHVVKYRTKAIRPTLSHTIHAACT